MGRRWCDPLMIDAAGVKIVLAAVIVLYWPSGLNL
jgi:hypothetical protein